MGPRSSIFSRLTPYLLLAPTIVFLAAFIGYPIVEAVRLAFTEPGGGSLGLRNFVAMFNDPYFWDAIRFTFLLAGLIIPAQLAIGLLVSVFLSASFRGRGYLIYTFLIPLTISDVAAALIWYNMLTESGYLNKWLMALGLIDSPLRFFGYEYRSMEVLAVFITEVWRATAIVFVILFANLQMISREYLEAAEVFGADALTKIRRIIIPLLKPGIQTALIIRTLFAMQIFAVVWILTGRDIPILAGEAYYWQVEIKDSGVAAAYSLVIALLSISLGALYIKLFKPKYLEAGGP